MKKPQLTFEEWYKFVIDLLETRKGMKPLTVDVEHARAEFDKPRHMTPGQYAQYVIEQSMWDPEQFVERRTMRRNSHKNEEDADA